MAALVKLRNAQPFGMVALAWMRDPNHTPEARTVYAILAAHANENRVTGPRTPDRNDLGRMLDIANEDVDHILAEMLVAGWITPMYLPVYRRGIRKQKTVYQLNDAALIFDLPSGDETAGSAL